MFPQYDKGLFHRLAKEKSTGRIGVVVEVRDSGREIRVKYSEGCEISDWLSSSLFDVLP